MARVMAKNEKSNGSEIYDHRSRTGTIWWDCLVAATLIALTLGWVGLIAWGLVWIAGIGIAYFDAA